MASYVINPLTNRSIQVGKPLWFDLVKQGILEDINGIKHPKEVYRITGEETEQQLEQIRQELSDPEGSYHVARGRGHRLENKLVKRYVQPKSQDVIKKVVQAGVKAVQKYPKSRADSNWEDDLTSYINKELVKLNVNDKPKKEKYKVKEVIKEESSSSSEQESESESEIEDEEAKESEVAESESEEESEEEESDSDSEDE